MGEYLAHICLQRRLWVNTKCLIEAANGVSWSCWMIQPHFRACFRPSDRTIQLGSLARQGKLSMIVEPGEPPSASTLFARPVAAWTLESSSRVRSTPKAIFWTMFEANLHFSSVISWRWKECWLSDTRFPIGWILDNTQGCSTSFCLLELLILDDVGFVEALLKQRSVGLEEVPPRHEGKCQSPAHPRYSSEVRTTGTEGVPPTPRTAQILAGCCISIHAWREAHLQL